MLDKKKTKTTAKKKTGKPVKKAPKKKKTPAIPKDPTGFPIVGIGASAGGLEALETFFTHMPPDKNIAFVIIQHLSPKHKSIMEDDAVWNNGECDRRPCHDLCGYYPDERVG
jgi:two-component system, chemotaxis family, CheB/CheR fusion protein